MKSIILRQHEVAQLSETGIVMVVRPVKPQPPSKYDWLGWLLDTTGDGKNIGSGTWTNCVENVYIRCQFGHAGEFRFVKETWALSHDPYSGYYLHYKAIDNGQKGTKVYAKDMADGFEKYNSGSWLKWRSSSTMPQWASRFSVECTGVKVEQINGVWSWLNTYKKAG